MIEKVASAFDWKIRLGDLVQLAGFGLGIFMLYLNLSVTLENHTVRLAQLENEAREAHASQQAILEQHARMLTLLEKRVDETLHYAR